MAERLVIIGAGGHGRVCAEVAAAQGFEVSGFVDSDAHAQTINGIPVLARSLGELQVLHAPGSVFVFVAIGKNDVRLGLFHEAVALGYTVPVLRHPTAWISPTAKIGMGSVLMPGAIVNANSVVGRCCIANTGCSLDHDNMLEDGAQICPGVRSAGNVVFGASAFVGTGASLIPGVRIGANAIVAAGFVVIRDVPAGAHVAGNPARAMRGWLASGRQSP